MNELIQNDPVTERIIACAMKVHANLAPGYLESVYEKAFAIELAFAGFDAKTQFPLQVSYRGQQVGDFTVDVLVDGQIIVELKAVQNLSAAHEAQLVNYLTATGLDVGLLINFGSEKLQVRRKHRIYRPSPRAAV